MTQEKTFKEILKQNGVRTEELERQILRHMESLLYSKDHQHRQQLEQVKTDAINTTLQIGQQRLEGKEREFVEQLTIMRNVEPVNSRAWYNISLLIEEYSHSKKDEVNI